MTLTGSVMAPLVGATLLAQIKISADRAEAMSRYGGGDDGQTFWLSLILIASVVRSLVHRMAGMRLWRDAASEPPALAGIDAYVAAAAAHSALWIAFLKVKNHAPVGALLGTAVLLMAWPLAVFAVTRLRRFRAVGARPPAPEDNGFEGLAVLMTIFGFVGLLASLVLVVLATSARQAISTASYALLLASGAALLVRSIVHVSVGARAIRGAAVNSGSDFLRYGNVGIAIGAVVGVVLTVWLGVDSSFDPFVMAIGVGVTIALVAWPAIVRRFVTWRHLADASATSPRRRSPDAGITALGWLLLAGAAATLSTYVASTLWEGSLAPRTSRMVMQLAGMPFDHQPAWWVLPLGLVELWAALELLAVSPRRRLVASAWAAATTIVTAVATAPDLRLLLDAPVEARATGYAAFLIALSPALVTLLLVNRQPVSPDGLPVGKPRV